MILSRLPTKAKWTIVCRHKFNENEVRWLSGTLNHLSRSMLRRMRMPQCGGGGGKLDDFALHVRRERGTLALLHPEPPQLLYDAPREDAQSPVVAATSC